MYRFLLSVFLLSIFCQGAFAQFLGFEANYPVDTIAVVGENFFEPHIRQGNNPGELFLMVTKREPSKQYFVRMYYSSDYGQTWTLQPGKVNNSQTELPEPGMDFVVGPDNELYVIFAMNTFTMNDWDIYFSKSSDLGVSWSPAVTVGDLQMKQARPVITMDDQGNLIIAYSSFVPSAAGKSIIKAHYSDDKGETWSSASVVNDSLSYDFAEFVDICSDDGKVYAVWPAIKQYVDADSQDICFSVSADTGKTWAPQVRVSDSRKNFRSSPKIVARNGNIYSVWHDKRNDGPPFNMMEQGDIFFSSSTDGGQTWLPNMQVNHNTNGMQTHPFLICDPNGVLSVLYVDDVLEGGWKWDLYYTYSMDFGMTWENAIRVDDAATGVQQVPSALIDDTGTLSVAWMDSREEANMNEIYYTRSTNSITSIADKGPEQIIDTPGLSAYPNPFNPETTIRFQLEEAAEVSMKIFNIRGQLVHSVAAKKCRPGVYEQHFNAAGLSSGIYFVQLKAGRNLLTHKIFLMK